MVAASALDRHYTIHDLGDFPRDGRRRELVDGRIVEWDVPTYIHAYLLAALTEVIRRFVRDHHVGSVVSGDAMVRMRGSDMHVRGTDLAFHRRGRRPLDTHAAATTMTPDFVIEIISPSDRAGAVQEKVADWLQAGVVLLWYVNPDSGSTAVFESGRVTHIAATEILDGGSVLPGLQLRLQDLLDELNEPDEP